MAENYSGEVSIGGSAYRKYRAHVNAWTENVSSTTTRVHWSAEVQMTRAYNYGVAVSCVVDGTQRGSSQGVIHSSSSGYTTVASTSGTTDIAKGSSARNVTVAANAWGQTVNGYGSAGGSTSCSVTVSIPAISYQQPHPPRNPTCSRVSDSQMDLAWKADYTSSTGLYPWANVLVYRMTDGGTWYQIAKLDWSALNYSDRSTLPNHEYRYALRAQGPTGLQSTMAECSGGPLYTTPAAPETVTVAGASDGAVEIGVTGSMPYATAFDVETRVGDAGWVSRGSFASMPVTVTASGGEVTVRVRATRGDLASAWVESDTITTITPPLAPSVTIDGGQSATIAPTGSTLVVRWVPNHPDGSAVTSVQVKWWRSGDSSTTQTLYGSTTSYQLPSSASGSPGTVYAQVRTKGADPDWGAWSSPVVITVGTPPTAYFTSPPSDGAVIDALPMDVSWYAYDATGVSSQTLQLLDASGSTLLTVRLGGSERSYRIDESVYQLANLSGYSLRLTVLGGSSLSTVAVRDFSTDWAEPAVPSAVVVVGGSMECQVLVTEGESTDGEPSTESLSVTRVAPDGTRWVVATGLSTGQQCVDPLPPLNVGFAYEVTATAETGASSVATVPVTVESDLTALNFGESASEAYFGLRLSPSASRTVERAVELYDFADGGQAGGLPVAYSSPSLSAGGEDVATTLDPADARELDSLARRYPMVWVRDPLGMRAYCAASWRFSRLVPLGRVETSVSLTETRWREAW